MKKVIIIHGWTQSLVKWESVIEELERSGIESVLFKVPGLTSSIEKVWNIDNYVDWLSKELNKEKGKVILLGHSNGGRIAMAYAKKFPEKIEKLILVDSAGIYRHEFQMRFKRFLFRNAARYGKKITSSDKVRKLLYKLARAKDYNDADELLKKTLINLWESDKKKIYSHINVPVSIIWGKDDKITPLKDARLLHKTIKNSELFVIDKAKHSPYFTNTKEFVGLVSRTISNK